jgi:hypothetical protein
MRAPNELAIGTEDFNAVARPRIEVIKKFVL